MDSFNNLPFSIEVPLALLEKQSELENSGSEFLEFDFILYILVIWLHSKTSEHLVQTFDSYWHRSTDFTWIHENYLIIIFFTWISFPFLYYTSQFSLK